MSSGRRDARMNVVVAQKRSTGKWHVRARRKLRKLLTQLRSRLRSVNIARPQRRLKLCESLSLGEKRVIAVVQFDRQRFLIGASANSISVLSTLPSENSFATALSSFAEPDQRVSL